MFTAIANIMVSGDEQAVRRLVDEVDRLDREGSRPAWRTVLRRLLHEASGTDWPGMPWRDTMSTERPGWRERAAQLNGEIVFAVDYQTCGRCRLGWVEQPYTELSYQRRGLARAGLAALRAEYPELSWHTLGGHFADSRPFWAAVGAGVPGGYEQRELCPHLSP